MNKYLKNIEEKCGNAMGFIRSKVNNERGSYGMQTIIITCILVIIALSMKAPMESQNTERMTKLTNWSDTAIDKEIGK